jgi:broad specificity phosphatase PhoE
MESKLNQRAPIKWRLMKIVLQLLLCLCATAFGARAQDGLSGKALIDALRQGGYTIYFRHAATDWTREDRVSKQGDWKSCDPDEMRQLSTEGRAVARRIGVAIRRLDIPIGQILASEYCRTRETAQLMDIGPVTPTPMVMNMLAAEYVGGREAVIDRARQALATAPRAGTNTIVVAHGNLMRAVSGAYAGEAGAVVFAPHGDGKFHRVAQLAPDDWERLARAFAQAE